MVQQLLLCWVRRGEEKEEGRCRLEFRAADEK